MKVKELIEKLNDLNPEMEVVMSSDSEGNYFSPLSETSIGVYVAEKSWHGEVFDEEWSAYDACMDGEEWDDFLENNPRSLVLWPTN